MQPIYHNWYQNKLKCGVSCLHSAAYQKSEVGRPWQVWGLCVIKREKHNVLGNDCNFKVNSARSQTKENCAFPVIIPLWLSNPSIVRCRSSRICRFKPDDVMKWCLNDASLTNRKAESCFLGVPWNGFCPSRAETLFLNRYFFYFRDDFFEISFFKWPCLLVKQTAGVNAVLTPTVNSFSFFMNSAASACNQYSSSPWPCPCLWRAWETDSFTDGKPIQYTWPTWGFSAFFFFSFCCEESVFNE